MKTNRTKNRQPNQLDRAQVVRRRSRKGSAGRSTLSRKPSPWCLAASDLKDPVLLAAKLAASAEALSAYIYRRLKHSTQKELADWSPTQEPSESSLNALVADLNGILRGALIWDPKRFAGVELRPETEILVGTSASGHVCVRCNRLLLEDAYPLAFRRMNVETLPLWRRLSALASAEPLPRPGDEASIAEHYRRVRPLGIQCAALFEPDDPEAVFDDAYLSILARMDVEAKAWAYLPYRIQCRALSDRRKARTSQRLHLQSLSEIPDDRIPANPPEDTDKGFYQDAVTPLLRLLTRQERRLILGRHLRNRSIAALAADVCGGASVSAVKTRLFRVLQKLRRAAGVSSRA